MVANLVPILAHIKPVRYKTGLRFCHAHRYVLNEKTGLYEHPPDAFYGGCQYRFSGIHAVPPRAMWYAGSTATCSVLETILRDVFGDEDGYATVLATELTGRRVTGLRSLRDLFLLDLTPAGLRSCAGDAEVRDAWHALTVTPAHTDTHAPTAALLAAADAADIAIDGFLWHSRQSAGAHLSPLACALFCPPAAGKDFAIDDTFKPIELDSAAGEILVRQALV